MRNPSHLLIRLFVALTIPIGLLALWLVHAHAQRPIHYGPDRQHTLDMCLPINQHGPVPALIMIHGGTWRSGGRQDWRENCRRAADAGVAGIAIDYRLVDGTPGHAWPAQLVDAQLAVRWVRANAGRYGIDPARICAIGDSAGGHITLFLASLDHPVAGDYAEALRDISPKVNCGVDWFGPIDLTGALTRSSFLSPMFAGVDPARYAEAERSASPIFAVGAGTAPMLIVQGTQDRFVHVEQAHRLQQALNDAHVPNQLRIYTGGHEFETAQDQVPAFVDAAAAFAKDPIGYLKENTAR